MPSYTISGRVIGTDGSPISGATVTVLEVIHLTDAPRVKGASVQTDSAGAYSVSWAEATTPALPWDLMVRASDGGTTVDSPLINDLADSAVVDIVLGVGEYTGRSEWDRLAAKLASLIGTTAPKDIPVDRIEWLARRADVFPTHLSFYIQAHRLADLRTVKAQSCYAFLRAGFPPDLPGLLRVGESSWEAALRSAWARRILPRPGDGSATAMDTEVSDEITAMRELVVDAATTAPTGGGVNQRTVFDTAGLELADQQTFMQLWLARSSLAQFWADLTTALDPTRVQTFQFTIQAATLVGNHIATLTGLQAERGTSITKVSDLAAWSVSDWDGFLVTHTVTPPDDVPGADATQKRQTYARALQRLVEDSYPTLCLRHSIDRDEQALNPPANTGHLVAFLTNNPDFDITRSAISHYLAGATDPWLGIAAPDQTTARANLELVQRVYRLTPRIGRYDAARVLLDNGIGSAVQVVGYTREEFIDLFGPLMPADDHDTSELAGKIWDNATKVHTATIGLASRLALAKTKADFAPLAMPGADQFSGETNGLADLATIFGSLDYCACEHCRSVFSPAAYLADLLAFLRDRPAKQAVNALEALSARRPDIRKILLDCGNTNTVLPYIDLVNELLEAKYANELDGSHQTTWTAEELRVHPEHLDYAVYDGSKPVGSPITGSVFPWSLPFSLPAVEARTYLAHLGVRREELIARFEPKTPDVAYRDRLAGEILGLNETEYQIIAGTFTQNPSADNREYWGYVAGQDTWRITLANDIPELLRRGRYTLDELRMWLELDFVNPDNQVAFLWPETCDLASASLPALDLSTLDRLHRLTRLQRRCKIPPRMLNMLVVDVCGGVLDGAALRRLADIVRVNQRLGLPWDELATLWASVIDARKYDDDTRSLYQRRFLSKEFDTIGASVLDQFNPAAGGMLQGEHNPAVKMTAEQRAIVLAAIGIKDDELAMLVGSDLAAEISPNEPVFSFANITALLRCVAFARGLRLSITELTTLAGTSQGLTGLDPFVDPAATLDFIAVIDGIRSSSSTVAELDWLLRQVGDAPFDDERTGRELAALARGLATIVEESRLLTDPDGTALSTNLAELLVAADLTTILAIVELSSTDPDATKHSNIDNKLGSYLDATLAKDVLVNTTSDDYIADLPGRRAWLLAQVVSYQRRRALVVDTLAGRFEIEADVAEALAFGLLTNPGGAGSLGSVLMPVFASEDDINGETGLTPASHQNQFDAWMRAAKAAMVASHAKLRADEVVWYSGAGAWLNLDGLPLSDSDTAASFGAWNQLHEALSLRSSFRAGELAHAAIAAASSLAEGIAIFADHGGWDAAALTSVAGSLGFVVNDPINDLAGEAALLRLRTVVETADRLGVDAVTLYTWSVAAPTMAQSTAIKTAARAKHDEAQWAKVAAPLRDAIREQQRDALVDAVIATDADLRDRNEVFNHLLIDVEMSACMQTSRIKQAISSVQLFIHRAMLHLEYDDVVFGKEAIARWEWMKNYRVWEANRKVFLYPENWIEPELRPNKTPEFEALEATLMQGTLDQARVEKALAQYLDKLDRVSKLEVMGVYRDKDGSGDLWVLGRTAGQPHEWFVRRRASAGAWQPWEEVPVQIEGDAVALVVRGSRIHLFWAIQHSASASFRWNYRVHHVQRTSEGWGKVSVSSPSETTDFALKTFGLHAWTGGDEICLGVTTKIPGSAPFVLSAFYFYPHDAKVRYEGSYFESGPYWFSVNGVAVLLKSRDLIALQPGYEVAGSRYVNRSFESGAGAIENAQGEIVECGTWFMQGSYAAQVFANRSCRDDLPALVHQSDFWSPDGTLSQRLPVIYDDRRRKYLLEPLAQYEYATDEGDKASTVSLGNLDVTSFWTCSPDADSTAPSFAPPLTKAQELRDEVARVNVWSGVVPGQNLQVAELEGIESPIAHDYQAEQMLAESQTNAQALTDPVGDVNNGYPASTTAFKLKIEPLYHPFARNMVELLEQNGLSGLYSPAVSSPLFRQMVSDDPFVSSQLDLNPKLVDGEAPIEEIDFRYDSPYGIYNWELFFHVPMLISSKLSAEQRFDEAQQWHHLMFNPIELVDLPEETSTSKFWRIKPFFEQSGSLAKDQFELMLGIGATPAQKQAALEQFTAEVGVWEQNPFDPHAVARIRPGVYQRTLLRKYIDNLVEWADNLFRRDTMESINEATMLYVLVAQLLGPRPQAVPAPTSVGQSFDDLAASGLDDFSNALVQLEGWITVPNEGAKKLGCSSSGTNEPWVRIPTLTRFWYFCYPPNAELLKYWDIIEDRLWKIRHCRNIEGIERRLPLFQPPIDPALLVRATAAGVDIQSVLAELDSGLPPYRFRSVHARAGGFTATLKALGGELLAALEKRDAEQLARIRAGHELELLDRARDIRVKQVDEATQALSSLKAARAGVVDRRDHYAKLVAEGYSEREERHFHLAKRAHQLRQNAGASGIVASVVGTIPQISATGGEFGGLHLANVANASAGVFNVAATEYDYHANKASLTASFDRRGQDWTLQLSQANKELVRLDRDIVAAEIRIAVATRELENHDLQVDQSRELDRYMRGKFSNRELYDWMIGQLATLYFQTYQLAFDLAKRAERAYRLELAIPEQSAPIIKYGYWDSLRKGLLAGERLNHDLERLDLAYMDRDVREYELRKSVSLAEFDPEQLRSLQETGTCDISLPEVLFDLDHPGHYQRRIRAVRVTIPAVVGPYTSLGARLELVDHRTRKEPLPATPYEEGENDGRFVMGYGGGEAIATSTAVSDGGLFNLDFRDERYLPFEYAGAISTWKLELPQQMRQFDYRTISDVVIHIDYTARDGGSSLRTAAQDAAVTQLNAALEGQELMQLVAVHDAFPDEWEQFLAPETSAPEQTLTLPVEASHFPYFAQRHGFVITQVDFVMLLEESLTDVGDVSTTLTMNAQASDPTPTFTHDGAHPNTAYLLANTGTLSPSEQPGTWTLTRAKTQTPSQGNLDYPDGWLDRTKVLGLLMLVRYTLSA